MGVGGLSVMADYDALLDDEIKAFIAETEAHYPSDASEKSVPEQRRIYDEMCRAFYRGRPVGIGADDQSASGVPVRVYMAGSPTVTVVYFHGGGFVVGGLDSHDDVCAEICAQTGYRVVSVDYRLAPEHVHPAPFDDAWTATRWVAEQFEGPLVLAGDSAGGNLAAAVAHHARGKLDRINGQVLIYPGLGEIAREGAFAEHAHAPMLSATDVAFYAKVRTGGADVSGDPTLSPLSDTSFEGLPPTVVFTADCDPLRDDGPAYCERLQVAGGKASWINETGLVHGYLRARAMSKRASDSFDRIVVAIESLGQGLWNFD